MTKDATPKFCQSTAPFIWSDFEEEKKRIIYKTRCKQWSCEYCAKVNYYQHWLRSVKGIENLENQGYKFDFVTLTSHERLTGTVQTYKVWKSAWQKLSTRYRRAYTKTYELPSAYVYVPELHADGRIHIHGVFSGHISKRWWKDNARSCGLGYQCETVQVEDRSKGINYALKYVSKSMGQNIGIDNFRRINYSRNIPPLRRTETENSWNILFKIEAIEALIEDAWKQDKDVILQGSEIKEILIEA